MECPFTVFPPKQKWIGRPELSPAVRAFIGLGVVEK
jgi:hypothetical protein